MSSADGGGRDHAPPRAGLPAWFEIGLLAAVLVLVCCGGLGLALAVAGGYSAGLALGVGLPVAALLTTAGARALVRRPVDRSGGTVPAVVAVGLAVGSAVWNVARSGSWLTVDRDPGAYALAARWISAHGSLQIPFGDSWQFTGVPVVGGSQAVYVDGRVLEFQFDHLLPALLAEVRDVGGDPAMLAANAVIAALGLLAIYAVGVRLTGRSGPTLVATAGLGLSLPVLYVTRATFSEPVTMLLLWAGAWLLVTAWDRASFRLGLLAGLALGASVMARIDSLVYLLVLPLVAAAVAVAGAHDDRRRRVGRLAVAAVLGAVAPVVVGTVDVVARSGQYYDILSPQIAPLQIATVVTTVVGLAAVVAARRISRILRGILSWAAARRARIGRTAGGVVVVVLLFAWWVRPAIDHPTARANSTVRIIQGLEGLSDDPGRQYAERSMVWLSWYLGPVAVAVAVIGLGLLVFGAVRGRSAALVVLGVAGAGTALYLYRLSNTPDQVFGVRRFVPATLPLFALAVAVAIAAVPRSVPAWIAGRTTGWVRRSWPRAASGGVVVVLVGVVAWPAAAAWPVRDFTPRLGTAAMFEDTCAAIGPRAAVVFPWRSYGEIAYPQALRDFCGVPVATAATTLTASEVEQAAAAWRARGRTLWVLDSEPDRLQTLFPGSGDVRRLGQVTNPLELADTISDRPSTYVTWTDTVYGRPAPSSA